MGHRQRQVVYHFGDSGRVGRRQLRYPLEKQGDGGLAYEHLDSAQEPLLWIPDAPSWCYGARDDWHRRVAAAINAVIDCDQL